MNEWICSYLIKNVYTYNIINHIPQKLSYKNTNIYKTTQNTNIYNTLSNIHNNKYFNNLINISHTNTIYNNLYISNLEEIE